jgi:hypothetical protein
VSGLCGLVLRVPQFRVHRALLHTIGDVHNRAPVPEVSAMAVPLARTWYWSVPNVVPGRSVHMHGPALHLRTGLGGCIGSRLRLGCCRLHFPRSHRDAIPRAVPPAAMSSRGEDRRCCELPSSQRREGLLGHQCRAGVW